MEEEEAELQLGSAAPARHTHGFQRPLQRGEPRITWRKGFWRPKFNSSSIRRSKIRAEEHPGDHFPRAPLSSVAYIIYLWNILLFRCAERETVIKNGASVLLVITRGAGRGGAGGSRCVAQSRALQPLASRLCVRGAPRRLSKNNQMCPCISIRIYIIVYKRTLHLDRCACVWKLTHAHAYLSMKAPPLHIGTPCGQDSCSC